MNPRQRKRTTYGTLSLVRKGNDSHRILFYRAESGREPVREWLKQLDALDRKRIGEDLYTLQLGWPTGMPLARKLAPELWEFRCFVGDGVARIIFTAIDKNLVLINGFIKKSKNCH